MSFNQLDDLMGVYAAETMEILLLHTPYSRDRNTGTRCRDTQTDSLRALSLAVLLPARVAHIRFAILLLPANVRFYRLARSPKVRPWLWLEGWSRDVNGSKDRGI